MNDAGKSLTKRKDRKGEKKGQAGGKDENNESINGNGNNGSGNDDDDHEFETDVSEQAIKERMKELTMGVASLAVDNDSEKPENERLNLFFEFAKAKNASGQAWDANLEKEVHAEAK